MTATSSNPAHACQPDNAVVITEIEVLALKKLVLVNVTLTKVLDSPMASREQAALTEVLAAVATRAEHANHMAKLAKPPPPPPEAI